MEIDMTNKLSVIFDMDGVVVNNFYYHQKAWELFCQKYNLRFGDDFRTKVFGGTNHDHLRVFFGRELSENEIAIYATEKEQIYRTIYKSHIEPVRGLPDFLAKLKHDRVPIALATSSPGENVEFVLSNTGLKGYFQIILDAASVKHGKPDPEIYLETAKTLGAQPSKCIVFEDSNPGIKSARSAGMKVIGLTTTLKMNELKDVDLVIPDFTGLNVSTLENLI